MDFSTQEATHQFQLTFGHPLFIFHAGQSYAQEDLKFYDVAVPRFEKSINPKQDEHSPLAWNEYVRATIAFLKKDLDDLKHWRERLAGDLENGGNQINLRVVDAMIRCFDKPYRVVYSDECIR